ncbi:alpha/beta fold hydrolase [Microbacterium indicum]|uniref:alpha/beta fold hydrolase n=1 Tax=Microbacterium indicum TaxID=358100 RepID=UPI000429037A|nr:alpha/beta hydrolase [Microbacterium indicum]
MTTPPERLSLTLPDGRSLSALRTAAAPRIVLVHGAGLNARTWDRTIAALGGAILAIDLPGHGDSSWREDADYSPAALAPDLATAIEAWADAPVHLVGHSLGGMTATLVASDRPDLVSRLTLVDILPGASAQQGADGLVEFYRRIEFDSVDDATDYAMSFGLGGERADARRGVELNTRMRADGKVEWKHHIAHVLSPVVDMPRGMPAFGDDLWDVLGRVAAPVELVRATRGILTDDAIARLARVAPGAVVHDVDAPHNVQETAWAELAALLAETKDPA